MKQVAQVTKKIGGIYVRYVRESRSQRHSVSRDSSVSNVTKHFAENKDFLRAHNNQPLVLIQSQINPAHGLWVHSFKTCCKIIFSYMPYIF